MTAEEARGRARQAIIEGFHPGGTPLELGVAAALLKAQIELADQLRVHCTRMGELDGRVAYCDWMRDKHRECVAALAELEGTDVR